jgi:hypothetical protein
MISTKTNKITAKLNKHFTNNIKRIYLKRTIVQKNERLHATKYMLYGGFSAKIEDFCPMIFSDYRIFIAQSRHIAYTRDVMRQLKRRHRQNKKHKTTI